MKLLKRKPKLTEEQQREQREQEWARDLELRVGLERELRLARERPAAWTPRAGNRAPDPY